ncbi:MAG: hypothetical protein V4662_14700 [Verrucomicrobiota bacterium]
MTSTATPVLTDFSDRLSPMVVKELRQGLRTRAFASTLLMMHALLIIATLITGSAPNADDTRWLFDGLSTLVLCFVMPFRVASALAEEVKLNTLDMLLLTRLSCSRIVFGKWANVALQSLLITLSLMPYVVARYMFGGLELTTEFLMLGSRWLGGCVIAAALVALSTIRQAWLRMVLIIVPLFFFGFGMFGWIFAVTMSRTMGSGSATMTMSFELLAIVTSLLCASWLIFAFLSLAASRISSQAEPLALIKRSVHSLAFVLPIIAYWVTGEKALLMLCTPVIAIITLDALTETLNEVPSAYVTFYRGGALRRSLITLFSPGWNSGFWLTLILTVIVAGFMMLTGAADQAPYFLLGTCSVWMVSAIIQMLPTRRSNDLLPIFLGMFALMYLITGMFSALGIMVAASSSQQPWLLAALPTAATIGASSISNGAEREKFLRISLLCAAFWPVLHAFLSLRAWRKLRPVREEARRLAEDRAASHA